MKSTTSDITYLLAARGLVFMEATGFTVRPVDRISGKSLAGYAGTGDTAFWTPYDFFMHERELRTADRARTYANLRAFFSGLIQKVTRPGEGTAYTEHVAA